MADNLQINIGGNAEGAKQAADEMGRSFAQNAEEMQKYLANLNKALDDFKDSSGKKITPFSLKDLNNDSLRSYAIAIKTCQDNIVQFQGQLQDLGNRTEQNAKEFDNLTNKLLATERAYKKLQSELSTFAGRADETTQSSDKLGKSTEKATNFLRQVGVTTALYGLTRIAHEFENAAEAAVKFQEAAEGLNNIKTPAGVEYLANNAEIITRTTDFMQGATAGAAAGAPLGPWGSTIGAIVASITNMIIGDRQREMQDATNSATQLNTVMEQIQKEKEQEKFNAEKSDFQTTFANELQMARTPEERRQALEFAISQFGDYTPEEIQKRIAYKTNHVNDLKNQIASTTWDMGNEEDRNTLSSLVNQLNQFQASIARDEGFLKEANRAIEEAKKEVAEKNKADLKAEQERAKQAEKDRKAKEKAEKEAAARELKDKKAKLNAEYKDLQNEKAKESQLLRETNKEMSDIISQREEKIAGMTSTRDSISTSFSKVGGSVGPQFAALTKSLLNDQASLKNYQDTMKKNIQTITSIIKNIDNEMKANREKLAALG